MHKNLVGQTPEQKRNCKEQKKRRDDIKKKFPKTITFYTHESIDHNINMRTAKIKEIFAKLDIKLRKSELKSLAITYYVVVYENKDRVELFSFIFNQLVKNNLSVDKLIPKLNKKFNYLEDWNKEILVEYLLFRK